MYLKVKRPQSLLGEIVAGPETSMKEFREMVRVEMMGLKDKAFLLDKVAGGGLKVPINERQDHHLALDFFRSEDDCALVSIANN